MPYGDESDGRSKMQSQDESNRRDIREQSLLRIWRPESSWSASGDESLTERAVGGPVAESKESHCESHLTLALGCAGIECEAEPQERSESVQVTPAFRLLRGSLEASAGRDSQAVGRLLRVISQEDDDPPPTPSETAYMERVCRTKRVQRRSFKIADRTRFKTLPAAVRPVAGCRSQGSVARGLRTGGSLVSGQWERACMKLNPSFAPSSGPRLFSIAALSVDGPLFALDCKPHQESCQQVTKRVAGPTQAATRLSSSRFDRIEQRRLRSA